MSQRQRYLGGIITKSPTSPTATSANGVWNLVDVTQNKPTCTWPTLPEVPTIGTASLCGSNISIAFTPGSLFGAPLTNYTATTTPGCITQTGSGSPIVVSGLTGGTSYTVKVKATTANGTSACSSASNSVSIPVAGQDAYTTPGSYCWVAPACVTSVSVVTVGGGGAGGISYSRGSGGGGGGLGYKNNYSVTAGSSYTVVVGAGGTHSYTAACRCGANSYFVNTATVYGGKGGRGNDNINSNGGTQNGDGGGCGGQGIYAPGYHSSGGGGGAGGYSGNGGNGNSGFTAGNAGGGGGGGGGGGTANPANPGGNGGGVGILGQGPDGNGGSAGGFHGTPGNGTAGSGGSGKTYGGGGKAVNSGPSSTADGGGGAVRIIWPGSSRSFPSTCTGDV